MKFKILIFLVLFLNQLFLFAQNPKREFRGAWIATVVNLDWPSSPNLSVENQKDELINLLDNLKSVNINAVIFQVRSECDAMYPSEIEPWSYWLTGQQGKAPVPFYDPLKFTVEEAHKRGMEVHAWFNPYRAERQINNYINSVNHVTELHPEWVLTFNQVNIKLLDPGLPQVRDYVTSVVEDVITRYDVDGVHFDDYFYPYPDGSFPGITNEDASTFTNYHRGFFDIHAWRRDNINELMRMVYSTIQNVKPHVKFGMSPFGIWKNGVPEGITGLDAYSTIYCDAVTWLNEEVVDYITPQLYWPFGGGQDYGKLLPWWANQSNNRHFYPGQALYRVSSWDSDELLNQVKLNRSNNNSLGSIFFRARYFESNTKGVTDSLINNYFSSKSFVPTMNWKDQTTPNEPRNLRYGPIAGLRGDVLTWDNPFETPSSDSTFMYSIYQLPPFSIFPEATENASNILDVTNQNYKVLTEDDIIENSLEFVVTSLDRNFNESLISNVVSVEIMEPAIPLLVSPTNLAINQRDTLSFTWTNSAHSNYNKLQISLSELFDSLIYEESGLVDTTKILSTLDGQNTYYWRVSAQNQIMESELSDIYSFSTGFPISTILTYPEDKTVDADTYQEFMWNKTERTIGYQFQLARGLSIEQSLIILDSLVNDTTLIIPDLNDSEYYTWQVRGYNQYGFSNWSNEFKFLTKQITLVDNEFDVPTKIELSQNYPNPFNPTTEIRFALPKSGFTNLVVYNILGEKISELVSETLLPGVYSVKFDGSNLSSGIYIYVLRNNGNIISNKMILTK